MSEVIFDSFKVRCSAISKVLSNSRDNPVLTEKQSETLAKYRNRMEGGWIPTTNQQMEICGLQEKEENGKKVILSDTCIEYLMIEYAWLAQGMIPVGKESLDLLTINKGKRGEPEAASMLIRLDKLPYKTHKERISNDYISGEIDLYLGDHVMEAEQIDDIKNSWDYPTFLKKINNGLENGQETQVQGYEDITGARKGNIVNALISCSPFEIEEMRWKLTRKLGAATPESPEVIDEWPIWYRSMVFDHIPIHKRIHKIPIEPFSIHERQALYDKVKICREWLSDFHERYQKMNLNATN
jgi:hypothetical protein